MKLPTELQTYSEPLEALQKLIARFNQKGVVIGGVAIGVLVDPRFTNDLDAMFLLSIKDVPYFLEQAKLEGIEERAENNIEFLKRSRVLLLKHVDTDTVIDVSLGILPFEQEVIARSSLQEVDDALSIRLPTPEDLFIMKAIAHRSKDLEDMRNTIIKYPNLDKKRIKKWVTEFAEILEMPDLWKQIEAILNSEE
jgi:hypothetical protein